MDQTSLADHEQVEVNMGDGKVIVVERETGSSRGPEIGYYNTSVNFYKWDYTYANDGNYTVYWNGVNRNAGILNITPPSDSYSFLVSTTLTINSLTRLNNSPVFMAPIGIFATVGQPLNYNLLAYDRDGDSLSYKLRTPLWKDINGKTLPLPGYQLPDKIARCMNAEQMGQSEFKLSETDGQLVWNTPCYTGEYVFAVAVEEWRNGRKIGEVVYDMQLLAKGSFNGTYPEKLFLIKQPAQEFTQEGYLVAKINQEVELRIAYNNLKPTYAPIKDATTAKLYASELSELLNVPVTFEIGQYGTGIFRFTPTEDLIRNRPYFVSFYGTTYYTWAVTSVGIRVRSDQPIFTLLSTSNLSRSPEGEFMTKPQKQVSLEVFAETIKGYAPTITTESDLANGASDFAFTSRDSTEGKIGKLVFTPSLSQATGTPQTITFRATHTATAKEPIVLEKQVQVIVVQQLPTATAEELAAATYLIYPNPAQNKFTVQAETPALLSIYSLQGQLVLEQRLQPGLTEVERPNATAGLYFYTLTTKDGQKKTGKLVLQ
ncbi:T9SS type A sorting domain-containing protein [Pontibacter sp. Tf4]|uniref:T9SS type A sorting domain-containing protein n=1 Tax=Pontibacter sp. Tf4 TaxID=2761620 RepID=UPI001627AF9B|nr:T9SS type A sorting domain-containing protein [Pontibacter sp. Tf4]MBB6612278.1 T9SS type A sorting domain-containing protein [Pontibacter sp. Tf4]